MPEIDASDFIEELRFDIQEQDMIKAKLVLAKIGSVEDSIRKMALFELNRADDDFAIPLIVNLIAEHRDLALAYPQLKEILYAKSLYHPDMLLAMLTRERKPENRVVLVEVAGEIQLEAAASQLIGILNEDEDEMIIKVVIAALGMIGETAATTAISEYLYSGSLELTIAAIYALGQLASPTAFQRLTEKLGADPDLDIMILDVFAADQSPEAIERLNEALSSHYAHLRNAGKQRLRDMGGKSVPILIGNLLAWATIKPLESGIDVSVRGVVHGRVLDRALEETVDLVEGGDRRTQAVGIVHPQVLDENAPGGKNITQMTEHFSYADNRNFSGIIKQFHPGFFQFFSTHTED